MERQLRPYQKEGFTEIFSSWETDDILMYVSATGSGKTVLFVEVIKRLLFEGKRVMLIAHRQELITQAWQTLYDNHIYAGIIMADYPERFELPVQVCSVQTIARRTILPPADYIVIDEGHHATRDNTYGAILKKYGSAKVLAVTATCCRLSGEGFEYLHPYKKTKLILGKSLKELTDEGWLVPLKYFAASIPDLSEVHLKGGEYVEEEARKQMELAPIVESYLEHANGKRGICFAINVEHSIAIAGQYWRAGIPAAHLDANTPNEERKQIFADFKTGKILVVVNVGIVTEGADFPNCEFVQLARPTKSLSLYLQELGRVTRALSGIIDNAPDQATRINNIAQSKKPFGIVLDCAGCLIDHLGPYWPHDWRRYFLGTKKEKKIAIETFEMLVFVAEDKNGNRIRTTKPEEVEGLRLIEITYEEQRKLINITSIKEFDKYYEMYKEMPAIKVPGFKAFYAFTSYCEKKNILMVDEIWNYLYKRLAYDVEAKLATLEDNRKKFPNAYPDELYNAAVESIKRQYVPVKFLKGKRSAYETQNQKQVLEHRFGVKVPMSGELRL
jgi:superfamily II DNA or RNA helicase